MRWAWSLWGVMKGDGDSGVGMVEMGAVITLVLHKGVAGWSTEGVFKEELAVIYITRVQFPQACIPFYIIYTHTPEYTPTRNTRPLVHTSANYS